MRTERFTWRGSPLHHPAASPSSCIELSTREREILQLVAQGMKNKEIADKLYISEFTARNHVISLLEKLGTRDRTEATAVAIKRGLVRIEEG